MDIGSVLIFAFIIVFMVLFISYSIELFIPIHLKFEVNGICRSYLYEIEATGILKEESKMELINKLQNLGLKDIRIMIDGDGIYGHYTDVVISSTYQFNRVVGLFKREDEEMYLKYERTLFNRKIIN